MSGSGVDGLTVTTALLGLLVPLSHLVGLVHAGHAVMSVRTAQGTIAWVVALLAFPYLAVPLYWILGRNRFAGYVRAKRSDDERLAGAALHVAEVLAPWHAEPDPDHHRSDLVLAAARLSGFAMTRGNRLGLLADGEAAFADMFAAIEGARDYVLVMFFIVKADGLGGQFKDLLIRRARAGVRVCFLYDEIGSYKLPVSYVGELEMAGVEVAGFGTFGKGSLARGNRFQVNFRNHRKILVVDGRDAYVGGLNVGDEYVGRSPRFGPWRDAHLRITGPAALQVQMTFLEDWFWATGRLPEVSWSPADPEREAAAGTGGEGERDCCPVMIIPTGPADTLESWHLFFIAAANEANRRLWIASPYFVPDSGAMAALQAAALRGVDVRVLLPDKPDHRLVYLASFTFIEAAEKAGVRLFRYQEGFLHQKVMLIDDDLAAVGTANLDNRSFRLNFEMMAIGYGERFAGEVARMLERDFAGSREVQSADYRDRNILFRAACRSALLFSPVL